jgi:hypothetical protein
MRSHRAKAFSLSWPAAVQNRETSKNLFEKIISREGIKWVSYMMSLGHYGRAESLAEPGKSIRAAIPGLIKIWRTLNAGECYGSSIAEAHFRQSWVNNF